MRRLNALPLTVFIALHLQAMLQGLRQSDIDGGQRLLGVVDFKGPCAFPLLSRPYARIRRLSLRGGSAETECWNSGSTEGRVADDETVSSLVVQVDVRARAGKFFSLCLSVMCTRLQSRHVTRDGL
jgi:hypothetical protein